MKSLMSTFVGEKSETYFPVKSGLNLRENDRKGSNLSKMLLK